MEHKTLICINTCNRLFYLKWFLSDYLAFCNFNGNYDLVVSLDGSDAAYLNFCNSNQIPLIFSEKRLGVGISKNRVFEKYPHYEHYFFLDDDVELLNPSIFSRIVEVANCTGIPHFSQGGGFGFKPVSGSIAHRGLEIVQSLYGSGQFSYFNGNALRKVGGWHPLFSKFKRGGHTEHSYRFYHAKLSASPFHHIPALNTGYMYWHQPAHVTQLRDVQTSSNSRLIEEEELIEQRLSHFPVETLSGVLTNGNEPTTNVQLHDYTLEFSKDRIKKIIANPFLDLGDKKQAIQYFIDERNSKIEVLTSEYNLTLYKLNLIKNSPSYKIGKAIAKPAHLVKKWLSR